MLREAMLTSTGRLSNRLHGRQFQLPPNKRLEELRIDNSILELVPAAVARENDVLPVDFDGETVVFVTPHQTDVMLQDKLRFILNCNVRFISRDAREVAAAIHYYYGHVEAESADSMLQEFADTAVDFSECDELEMTGRLPLSALDLEGIPLDRRGFACSLAEPRSSATTNINAGRNGLMYYTIAEGQRVLAHRRSGKIEIIAGPKRLWKGRTRFEPMRHYVAHPSQYLSVRYRDGAEETIRGPADLWFDPRVHEQVAIHECLDLATKEAVVIYGGDNSGQESAVTTRRIFHGPGLFAPQPGEWLHRFSWHASHGGSRGEEKRPNALQFQKLCLMPDQMYHDVRDVRTADDAVLTIRLMIFFELVDIEKMLDTTHDPIGDFINAATSDVVEFTGKRSFDEFKQQTEQLNEAATYQQLLHRAQQCGYKINNVVYRGYGAPDSLQAMHDEAIQSRTRLQLEKETERQAQEVEDYKLTCQMERAERRREEQMTEVEHDLEMKRRQAEAEQQEKELRGAFLRQQRRAEEELTLEMRARSDQQQQAHLESLRTMKVDLTQFLTQTRADQVIEVRGDAVTKPELHLENGKRSRLQPR